MKKGFLQSLKPLPEKIHMQRYIETIMRVKFPNIRRDTGAFEVILVKENGVITEGSRSNLFFVKKRMSSTLPWNQMC